MTNFWTAEIQGNEYHLTAIETGGDTIDETAKNTPEGAYTTFRTYSHYGVLRLDRHFSRLEETSHLAGYEISINRAALKTALISCIDSFPAEEQRVRITVDLRHDIGLLYIAVEKLHVPALKFYAEGIDVVTALMHRDNPKAKLSNFLERAASVRSTTEGSYEEIIMYDESGNMLEGLSSNFYAIKNGKLFTAEDGVLSGTTRDFVLNIAKELGQPLIMQPVQYKERLMLDEAFITSTSRSILPIRSIDGANLEHGAPGPITKQLMQAFQNKIDSQIEYLKS